MLALRAPLRVRSWLCALLLCGCGRLGFDQALIESAVDTPGKSPMKDGGALQPGEAPNDPVPEDPPVVVPEADAASEEDGGTVTEPDGDAGGDPQDAGPSLDAGPTPDAGTSPDAGQDAGTTPPDAGTDGGAPDAGAPDAGAPDAGTPDAGPPRACRGVLHDDVCWYLSGNGESCDHVCRSHGGFDARSSGVVGSPSQGGDIENCTDIFRKLGFSGTVRTGARSDGAGLGCHRWEDGVLWWLKEPGFDRSSSSPNASRVCGCKE